MPEIGELTDFLVLWPQTCGDCFGYNSTTKLALDVQDAIERVCEEYIQAVPEGKWLVIPVRDVMAVEVAERRVPSIGCQVSVL